MVFDPHPAEIDREAAAGTYHLNVANTHEIEHLPKNRRRQIGRFAGLPGDIAVARDDDQLAVVGGTDARQATVPQGEMS